VVRFKKYTIHFMHFYVHRSFGACITKQTTSLRIQKLKNPFRIKVNILVVG